MTSELRAAAERLRRIKAGEMLVDVYDDIHPDHIGARMADERAVAYASLDLFRANDAEPITVEWLRESGWTFNGKWWSSPLNSLGNSIVVIDLDNGPEWSFGQVAFGFLMIPEQKTRRQLRDLLAALGIEATTTKTA